MYFNADVKSWYDILLFLLTGSTGWYSILGILQIAGLYLIFKKSGIKPFWAFVPFARLYRLAECADREEEGRILSISSFLLFVINVLGDYIESSLLATITLFAILALVVIELVYEIRVCAGLVEVYKTKKIWIVAWVIVGSLTSFYWGVSKKLNPSMKVEDFRKDAIEMASGRHIINKMDKGLAVGLQERTVMEFFHKKYLLRDINFYIKPGRMVLLLGGSGAGKTTLLNAIIGYEKADAEVILNGTNVYEKYRKMIYEVGFVPQQNLIRGKDTIEHTLLDTAKLRLPSNVNAKERKARVNEVMDIFGLTPSKTHFVDKLSGGQKRRLSIAMELLSNPSLFILDEPDSGLDGVMARELMTQLRSIADQGKIVIVITHTPDRVIDLFDDVIVLAKDSHRTGRLAFFGEIGEARAFFEKESMEKIVQSINSTSVGGDGRADEFVLKFATEQNKEVANG
jgi:ABC-type multidrug transport system ATPase subunit